MTTKNKQEFEERFHQVMRLLRDMQMEHGTCQPRARRACTHCNAKDDLDKLLSEYKGPPIGLASVPNIHADLTLAAFMREVVK